MSFKKISKKILWLAVIFSFTISSGCGCKERTASLQKVNLEIWGLFDSSDVYNSIISNYRKIYPNISISYRKTTPINYRQELIEAMASDKGPDIFLIGNTWLPVFKDKVAPAPKDIFNEKILTEEFVDVVSYDFLDNGKVYGAPLSVDSLALFYNKDLFNAAGITEPPKSWEEFVDDVKLIKKEDPNKIFSPAGAAMGTARNINRAADILYLLMMQGGAEMVSADRERVSFNQNINKGSVYKYPGQEALEFYTKFAESKSPFYTWSASSILHNSIDAFGEGDVGMMFSYSWSIEDVTSKSPKLNLGIAPVPQLNPNFPVGYANYWGYVVAKNNPKNKVNNDLRIKEAWKFIRYLTTKPFLKDSGSKSGSGCVKELGESAKPDYNFDPAADYLKKTKKPAARKDIIKKQKNEPIIGVFAEGNLIARSWYQADPEKIDSYILEAIEKVNIGQLSPMEALNTAASRINQIMK